MSDFKAIIAKRKRQDFLFNIVGIICTLVGILTLGALLVDLFMDGATRLNWTFLTSFPSRFAERAGILSSWVGTLLIMMVTAFAAVPLGVSAGIYLEEYARRNWLTNLIEINIANLAGVPSIIYGLMALGLLVYQFRLGTNVLTGGLTLAFLILPIVIVATREALRTIPQGIREAAYALGSTKWQVVRHHLLPYSLGGTMTGIIIALSRAIGETAPLITIGALTFIAFPAAAADQSATAIPFFGVAVVAVFGVADTDVQLGLAPGSGLRRECRRRRAGADRGNAAAECRSDNDSLPRSQAHQVVNAKKGQ